MAKRRRTNTRPPIPPGFAIESLRALGLHFNHPLILADFELPQRRTSQKKQQQQQQPNSSTGVNRFASFSGIPGCCWNGRGSGATAASGDESAVHAFYDFFRLQKGPEFVDKFLSLTIENQSTMYPEFAPYFAEFEKAIAMDFLSISRCGQYDMTSPSILRGKELRKYVLLNINNPDHGYGVYTAKAKKDPTTTQTPTTNPVVITLSDDDDDQIQAEKSPEASDQPGPSSSSTPRIPQQRQLRNSSSSSDDGHRIVIDESERLRIERRKSAKVAKLQAFDAAHRAIIQEQMSEEIRRYNPNPNPNYFGAMNNSRSGPPEVFATVPGSHPTGPYEEAPSSDDDDDSDDDEDVPRKRAKLVNGESIVLNTTASSSQAPKEKTENSDSDEEIGDVVDEWNEEDDVEEEEDSEVEVISDSQETEKEVEVEIPKQMQAINGFYDGDSTHKEFREKRNLPVNYQAKTIGVVFNEKLGFKIEDLVLDIVDRSYDSVCQLSQLTWDHYLNNIQSPADYRRKMDAQHALSQQISFMFPGKRLILRVTGSTINGCGAFNSDMDLCLCFPNEQSAGTGHFDDYHCDRGFATQTLRKINRLLRRPTNNYYQKRITKSSQVISAKVPIIKLHMNEPFAGIEVDINVNNIAGIYNSHLIHYYSLIDIRFPSLALLVKHWAMREGISDAQSGYLNSYSIILLVLHFLQCGVTPAVLPNLQYVFPDRFDRKVNVLDLGIFQNVATNLPTIPPNMWSMGQLVVGFFHYYAQFDFAKDAISIRSAQVVPRKYLPQDTALFAMFVEEPFDAVNTARTVRGGSHMNDIKKAFRRAVKTIQTRQSFTVGDLGVHVVPR